MEKARDTKGNEDYASSKSRPNRRMLRSQWSKLSFKRTSNLLFKYKDTASTICSFREFPKVGTSCEWKWNFSWHFFGDALTRRSEYFRHCGQYVLEESDNFICTHHGSRQIQSRRNSKIISVCCEFPAGKAGGSCQQNIHGILSSDPKKDSCCCIISLQLGHIPI